MAKWATKLDNRPGRCPRCGKRLRRGDWTYKESGQLFCRDCGRKKDRASFEKARERDRRQVRRQLPALPERVEGAESPQREFRFPDGGSYKGSVENGCMHGKGTYTFANGDSYSGEFREGFFCGMGAYTFADGEQHAGVFENDRLNGEGYCIFPDGGRIKGVFSDDMFISGRGWRSYGEDRYRGEFGTGAVMDGVGVYIMESGDCYIGEVQKDSLTGMGRLLQKRGGSLEGEFLDGELRRRVPVAKELLERAAQAAGVRPRTDSISYPDGSCYTGTVAFGFPHGEGRLEKSSSGYTGYTGRWHYGELEKASGRLTSRKGNVYEGEIGPKGRPHGHGVMVRVDGSSIEGDFVQGSPVDGEMQELDPDGIATRRLYLGGRAVARRGWWEALDSEDEERDGTNLWLMAEGERVLGPVGGSVSLGSVMLADSVSEIASMAFSGLYIRRIIIPDGVKIIGRAAFGGWGPSQVIAVEGDMTRFTGGWLDSCFARVISLDELLGEGQYDQSALIRRRLRFPGGAWYEGETLDGVMHGNGVYRFENGDRYEGEFRGGCCSGWGLCSFKGLGKYLGEFREDQPMGAGTMFYEGGDRYEGEWLSGRRFGFGRYTYADGEVVEGVWRDGELLRPCPCPGVLERLCPDSLT